MENVNFDDEIEISNIEPDTEIKEVRSIDDYFYNDENDPPFYFSGSPSIDEYIKKIPSIITIRSNKTSTAQMFMNVINVTEFPKKIVNTENVTDMTQMFCNCRGMLNVPEMNTKSVTNMEKMFYNCSSLETIPFMDTTNVTNMNEMFNYCTNLKSIPLLNTSNVTKMGTMFQNCKNLKTIPLLDTSNVTDMAWTFSGCTNLQTVPDLNTQNVTDMRATFQSCTSLRKIPKIDTSNVKTISSIFRNCTNLQEIPELDASNLVTITNWNTNINLNVLFGGFKDLGKADNFKTNMTLKNYTNIQTVYNIINDLYDLNLNGKAERGIKVRITTTQQDELLKLDSSIIDNTKNKGWDIEISE